MKKILFFMFISLLALVLIPASVVSAAETSGKCGDDIDWSYSDGTLTLTGSGEMYDYSSSNMPWYSYRNDITTIVIGNGITTVGNSAFHNFPNLTQVTLSNTLRNIGNSAFFSCEKLGNVTFPDSLRTVGSYAFEECTGMTSIVIPSGVTALEYYSFAKCTNVTSVTFKPAEIESLNNVFYNLGTNTDGVKVTFDKDVVIVPSSIFKGCEYVTEVVFEGSELRTVGNSAFTDCIRLKSVALPEGVKTIGNYAFENCKKMTDITIPASVTSLNYYSFAKCINVTSVTYKPAEIESLNTVFYNLGTNTDGVKVTFAEGVVIVPDGIFKECSYVSEVVFNGDNVRTIGSSAFNNCSKLGNVTIPESVKAIESYAFKNCSSMTSVTIPSAVTALGQNAFSDCDKLNTIIYQPVEVTELYRPFSYTGEESDGIKVIIDEGVEVIPGELFVDCAKVTELVFNGNTVTTINGSAFKECGNLKSVTFPNSLEFIGNYAFQGCKKMDTITIPASVKNLGHYAFANCENVTNVYFYPAEIESLSNVFPYIGSNTDGVTATFGEGVKIVPKEIFDNSEKLTKVIFEGNTLETIGSNAFEYCKKLNNVVFPNSLKHINGYAFHGCSSMTEISIPSSVLSIGYYGFTNCTGVTVLNYNAIAIESVSAFGDLGNQYDGVDVVFGESVQIIPSGMFDNDNYVKTVTIKGESLKTIGNNAFSDCKKLESINLPKSLSTVGRFAFAYCENLTTATYAGNSVDWKQVDVKDNNNPLLDALVFLGAEPAFIRGDVNLNGKIDSRDYLLLKRAYFGTSKLNEIATAAADVNKNDKIDSRDYMLLKRAYFGTYTIEQ